MRHSTRRQGFATRAVHAGERAPEPDFSPVVTPIYNAVTYLYDSMESLDAVFADPNRGYAYTRYGNPTNQALEEAVASLEGGEAALSFASGMAAITATLLAAGTGAGDHIVSAQDVYGATYSLLSRICTRLGVHVRFVDVSDLKKVEKALVEERPRIFLFEVMSNPLLKIADIPSLVQCAHRNGAKVIVDSSFTPPLIARPLEHGADYVVHSSTKYLCGHGDTLAGIVVCSRERQQELREIVKLTGGVLGPNEAYLVHRGLKTLSLRYPRQCENAAHLAAWLEKNPRVSMVRYPGLASHPQHELAKRVFSHGLMGGMVSFELKDGDRDRVWRFMEALRLCLPVTTMGDIYTEVLYPAMSSHRSLTPEERKAAGIGDGLVRLSAGIEDVTDIIADLDQALL
jgi:cystathionine beta-lyase/cystathionine gamma-synthase